MAAAGLRYDSSVFPIQHPYYGVPTAPTHPYWVHTSTGNLMEFPPATVRLFGQNLPIAGGGYMRILPLKVRHRRQVQGRRHRRGQRLDLGRGLDRRLLPGGARLPGTRVR